MKTLLIRRYLCGYPDPFRSVRDLGRVPARCSRQSGEPECRPSAWLPAAHDTRHCDALVLVTDIGPSTGEGTAPCPDPAVCQPEKRKVGSSTLPLTTSSGRVPSALTSVNADWALPCASVPSDHDCPYVTVVGRSLSHADRTPRLGAPGSRPLRPDLAVSLSARSGEWAVVPARRPSPIGLIAARLFAGGEVSSADSRVRSPGTFTCARCPAVRSALDAGPEAYHNPAAVWWGAFPASPVIRDQVVTITSGSGSSRENGVWVSPSRAAYAVLW